MDHWFFACEGDPHFNLQGDSLHWNNGDYISRYTELKKKYDIDMLLVVGDLTESGNDGSSWCPFVYNEERDEARAFINKYVIPIEIMNIPIKMTLGNHDIANKWKYPDMYIAKYIRDRYDSTYSWWNPDSSSCYSFEHKGFLFISMGIYPKNLKWLRRVLPMDKTKPIIFFFHYSFDPNNFDWMTEIERNAFYEVIKDHNVKLIITGHSHTSLVLPWKNITTIVAYNTVLIEVQGDNLKIHINGQPPALE